ncbi:hypothetical protein [Nocardioides sp. W7]|uniref:hypothetical protein n=1 Tax=Nocardioides sp. W7 TaxID=2931390 RepID=UPI001FD1D7D0|nr:hypothetical protein [Nocardioides sp. W7]
MATSVLGVDRNYSSLSVRDLLEARDHYHWHLTHLANVVGTAVGLYYIRTQDPWPSREASYRTIRQQRTESEEVRPPRTFANSEIREYSWPCVLVLVDTWLDTGEFGSGPGASAAPTDMVPKTLFLPDGRTVPVCVVLVSREQPTAELMPRWSWPRTRVGGGCPLISAVQGRDNVASVGALVTDGHTTYALTSRHVAGPEGHPASTILGGRRVEIGRSASRQITRLPFSEAYPEYAGRRSHLTVDVGLVAVEDLDDWTSQVLGLPHVGELADLSERNIGTRLIDAPVTAYGAASGLLRGRVAALFFRHRSRGGYDDVTDFLIAPVPGTAGSQPGDSGTVWHLAETDDTGLETLRPLAVQWGGQRFGSSAVGAEGFNFALAASMTTVLRLLDVELVVEHNTSAQPFWGKTGHYSIAALACTTLAPGQLATLMTANTDRISFDVDQLDPRHVNDATVAAKKAGEFIPLADVPDLVWKTTPDQVQGGRDVRARVGPEHPAHHADGDVADADGATLRGLTLADPANLSVEVWQDFYTRTGHAQSRERGLLPFRVWQFFDEMTEAAARGDTARFVCAAGLLSHYVGDACQSLHGSQHADGIRGDELIGQGVHSAYESAMVDHHAVELLAGMHEAIDGQAVVTPQLVGTGHQAASAVVGLMERSARRVDPLALATAYAVTQQGRTAKHPTKNKTVTTALWQQFGEGTTLNMADGVVTLAMLWESAWEAGSSGDPLPAHLLGPADRDELRALYEDPKFVESLDLDQVGAVLSPP